MIKFEKKYLYTFADVEDAKKLIGKKGIFDDYKITFNELKYSVLVKLSDVNVEGELSFKTRYSAFRYFYYDPNLEYKRAYYFEGKKIQVKNILGDWVTLKHEPQWYDYKEYRIKPETKETHLTNRELSMWLAKGNGQARPIGTNQIITSFTYLDRVENELCVFEIRKWSDSEWHEATKEYIEGDK